jgi:hypothetical protein
MGDVELGHDPVIALVDFVFSVINHAENLPPPALASQVPQSRIEKRFHLGSSAMNVVIIHVADMSKSTGNDSSSARPRVVFIS